ncbi:MAG: V-type ATPase subunit [Candidatus Latescibacteria bacterium]|nr:V-type ATPase subunit [Candidatus Latescibacterota bacterium]
MKFSENPAYGFAIGRVRAKETYLIKRTEYDRMVNPTSEFELMSNVKNYWHIESAERESQSFDNLLNAAHFENEQFFAKYCIDASVRQLILDDSIIKNQVLNEYLQQLDNEFLNRYFQILIDLENIRSFARIKNLAVKEKQDATTQKKLFNKVFLLNGTITETTLANLFSEPWEALVQWSANTPYHQTVEAGISYLLDQKSFLRFERMIQEQKQHLLLKARYTTFGFEPLVAYYLFKETEIRNLRKIYYAISEKTPLDQIKESVACVL